MGKPKRKENDITPETMMEILEGAVEAMAGKDVPDTDLSYNGTKIVLPAKPKHMPINQAIAVLSRKKQEEESTVSVAEVVEAYPWDGARSLMAAMKELFGWPAAVPKPGWFGTSNPPSFRGIETGYGVTEQVVWGRFELPNIDGYIETSSHYQNGKFCFAIVGEVKHKDVPYIKELADLTRAHVRKNSIYKGKAVALPVGSMGDLDTEEAPRFIDTTRVTSDDIIFSRHLESSIQANLFAPVMYTQECEDANIPINRGCLLAGPYGVGKTMVASVLAGVCEKNGWTFIMTTASALKDSLSFAEMYAPCVVFAEDIDRVVSGDRTEEMDNILNTVDGLSSKNGKIMVVLTTNFVENINKAMIRPGRLDSVINITPPDAEAVQRLLRHYAGDRLAPDADLSAAGKALDGQIPAVVAEVVQRAKLFALSRSGGQSSEITCEAIIDASVSMARHLELMKEKVELETPADRLYRAMQGVYKGAVLELTGNDGSNGAGVLTKEQHANIERIRDIAAEVC